MSGLCSFQAKAPSYTTHLQIQVLAEKSFQDFPRHQLTCGWQRKKKLYKLGTKLDMFLELNFIISLLKFDAFLHQVYCSTDSYDSAITFSITTLAILTPSMPIKRLHSVKYIMLCSASQFYNYVNCHHPGCHYAQYLYTGVVMMSVIKRLSVIIMGAFYMLMSVIMMTVVMLSVILLSVLMRTFVMPSDDSV